MFINSNLKAKEKLIINDLSKIKCKARSIESSFSINLNTKQENQKIHKQQNIIAWMIGQIENKNQQQIIARPTNNHSLCSILVDFQEQKELGRGVKFQPHPSLKANAHLISRSQPQTSRNSGNNLIFYFHGKSTTIDSEALVRAITLHK